MGAAGNSDLVSGHDYMLLYIFEFANTVCLLSHVMFKSKKGTFHNISNHCISGTLKYYPSLETAVVSVTIYVPADSRLSSTLLVFSSFAEKRYPKMPHLTGVPRKIGQH